jgi:hypothetical protein
MHQGRIGEAQARPVGAGFRRATQRRPPTSSQPAARLERRAGLASEMSPPSARERAAAGRQPAPGHADRDAHGPGGCGGRKGGSAIWPVGRWRNAQSGRQDSEPGGARHSGEWCARLRIPEFAVLSTHGSTSGQLQSRFCYKIAHGACPGRRLQVDAWEKCVYTSCYPQASYS